MTPEEYRDRELGGLASSHPHWQVKRIAWTCRMSLYVLAGFAAAGLLSVLVFGHVRSLFTNVYWWMTAVAMVAAACVSGLLTLALCARGSRVQAILTSSARPGERAVSMSDYVVFQPWVIAVGFALASIGPVVVARIPQLATWIRLLFQFVALLPLPVLIVAMQVAERRATGKPAPGYRQAALVIVGMIVLPLIVVVFAQDVAHAVTSSSFFVKYIGSWLPGWLARLGQRLFSLFLLIPLSLVLLGVWKLWSSEQDADMLPGPGVAAPAADAPAPAMQPKTGQVPPSPTSGASAPAPPAEPAGAAIRAPVDTASVPRSATAFLKKGMAAIRSLLPRRRAAVPATPTLPLPAAAPSEETQASGDARPEGAVASGAPTPPQGLPPWPAWLTALLAELPEGCTCAADGPVAMVDAETSPYSDQPGLAMLFGGRRPTHDQVKLFERFRDSYREVIAAFGSMRVADGTEPSADLLALGDPGSGRTTGAVACAIYSALVRGQRVLYIVPDAIRQASTRSRFEKFLSDVGLQHYLGVGVVSDENAIEGWLRSAIRNAASASDTGTEGEVGVLPHIVISTPENLERYLYGAAFHEPGLFEALRRFILLLEVVIVDDFMEFADAVRSHLPFLLDKQRLILAAESLPVQVLVTCPRLASIAQEEVFGPRLYTMKRLRRANIVNLRPRPSAKAWRVDLGTRAGISDTVRHLVLWCLRRGLEVVLYRKGIGDLERENQRQMLTAEAKSDRLTVLAGLDQLAERGDLAIDAVFYQVAVHQEVCLALRLHLGSQDTVIFSISATGEAREAIDSGIIPIVAARSAKPLLLAHLRSALRFVRDNNPVRAELWQQFGVNYLREPSLRRGCLGTREISIGIDHCADLEYGRQLWPYLYLRERIGDVDPIELTRFPAESHGMYRDTQGTSLLVGRAGRAAVGTELTSAPVKARWMSPDDDQEFVDHDIDLVHLGEFRLAYGMEAFVPRLPIKKVGSDLQMYVQHWHGDGEDYYLPVCDLGWDLREGFFVEKLGGGPEFGMNWFSVVSPADTAGLRRDVFAEVRAALTGLMTDHGLVQRFERVGFSFVARLSGLLLNPKGEMPGNVPSGGLPTEWRTGAGAGFNPVLTGAMNYAFQVRVPGLGYFARMLAFDLKEGSDSNGDAIVWFIEPLSSGRTVMHVLGSLWSRNEENKRFLRSVDWFLEQVEKASSPQRLIRRFARTGYEGDDAIGDVMKLRTMVQGVIAKADAVFSA